MSTKRQVRKFRPYLMRYLHANDPNFEPVLRDLLNFEHELYDQMTKEKGELRRGARTTGSWEKVFDTLTNVLTPIQIQQLFNRFEKDFKKLCDQFQDMAEAQKLLGHDEGGNN